MKIDKIILVILILFCGQLCAQKTFGVDLCTGEEYKISYTVSSERDQVSLNKLDLTNYKLNDSICGLKLEEFYGKCRYNEKLLNFVKRRKLILRNNNSFYSWDYIVNDSLDNRFMISINTKLNKHGIEFATTNKGKSKFRYIFGTWPWKWIASARLQNLCNKASKELYEIWEQLKLLEK